MVATPVGNIPVTNAQTSIASCKSLLKLLGTCETLLPLFIKFHLELVRDVIYSS